MWKMKESKNTYNDGWRSRIGLGRAAAGFLAVSVFFQPVTVLAGPASDTGLAGSTGAGPGSSGGTVSSPAGNTSGGGTSAGTGVSAVTSGLGTYVATEEEGIGAIARGIDVSYWQQDIDWNQVASDNVQFVMLATRFRGAVDPYFSANANGASQMGIRLGAYIYSYATSVEMAQQEADFVLNLIKDYPISFPVVFDAEDANSLGTLSPSEVSDVINAFCRRIEDAGYYPMVYANEYWISNKIDMSKLNYDIWVARYGEKYTYSNPAMWQASNTGSVRGISGNVDIDYLYKDFTQIIPGNLWRTIGGSRYYYQNHVMQKSTWINDGQNWYYMNSAGNPSTGWLDMNGSRYYLESDGKMATGWKALDGSWRYFDPTGEMAIGWRAVDGLWYYMNESGQMQTGWIEVSGNRYHLGSDGAMQTGFQDLDGSRYYFDGSGAMTKGWQAINGAWYYMNENGQMQTGWQAVNGAWYYMNESGQMQTGWISVGGSRYYLGSDGAMQTGMQTIDGAAYYFDPSSGAMASGTQIMADGVLYQAGADGICTPVAADAGTSDVTGSSGAVQETESSGPSGPAGL